MISALVGIGGAVVLALVYWLGYRDGARQMQAYLDIDRLAELASRAHRVGSSSSQGDPE
jgi:hypothetical protein